MRGPDIAAFLDADKAMDEAVAMAVDNPFAVRLAAPLQTHSRRFWFRYRANSGLAEAVERHVALIGAILDGREEEAGAAGAALMDLLGLHAREASRR